MRSCATDIETAKSPRTASNLAKLTRRFIRAEHVEQMAARFPVVAFIGWYAAQFPAGLRGTRHRQQ